jgi:hypothetical protein
MILAGTTVGPGVLRRPEEMGIGYSAELQWSLDWKICISIVYSISIFAIRSGICAVGVIYGFEGEGRVGEYG